jgi:hypothetical protein
MLSVYFEMGDDCFYRSCISFCRTWNYMTKLPRASTRLTSQIFCSISSRLLLIHHTQPVRETFLRMVSSGMWFTYSGNPRYIVSAFSTLGFFLHPEDRSSISTGLHGIIPEDSCHNFCCENLRFFVFVKLEYLSECSFRLQIVVGFPARAGIFPFSLAPIFMSYLLNRLHCWKP